MNALIYVDILLEHFVEGKPLGKPVIFEEWVGGMRPNLFSNLKIRQKNHSNQYSKNERT